MRIQPMMEWDHMPGDEKADRSPERPPIVTIFGAGITGMSVAHELIERGFSVHVVESTPSPTEEYSCQVGGMAANQLARVRLDKSVIKKLVNNPDLETIRRSRGVAKKYKEYDDAIADLALNAVNKLPLQSVQKRFDITQRIAFAEKCECSGTTITQRFVSYAESTDSPHNSANPDWLEYSDIYGIKNFIKLEKVYRTLHSAYHLYHRDWIASCTKAELDGDTQKTVLDSDQYNSLIDLTEFCVMILGYTDDTFSNETSRETSKKWAEAVRDELDRQNKNDMAIPRFVNRVLCFGLGNTAPVGDQFDKANSWRSNRVEIHIAGQRVPGEHGYRFFPGFYRNLFNTMKRTPVFDEEGDLTHETAFNQLVETPDVEIGFGNNEGLTPIKLSKWSSVADISNAIACLKTKIGFTNLDLIRLQAHLLKYMTSCKSRRIKEAEDVSFWQYIGADRVKYSPRASSFLNRTPQALVAMSATETDARIQYNIAIQMLAKNPLGKNLPDFTLNASTSDAWLNRWKGYLKKKGVNFYTGYLKSLQLNNEQEQNEYVPEVIGEIDGRPVPELDNPALYRDDPNGRNNDVNVDADSKKKWQSFEFSKSDFFVMALPFERASQIIADAYLNLEKSRRKNFSGPFRQFYEFDLVTGRREPGETGLAETSYNRLRDPRSGRPTNTKDPLRDISGVQYFTSNNYRLGKGHAYYPRSQWALSSISQLSFWRERVVPIGKYVGQMSFDIGDWYTPHVGEFFEDSTAWNSSRQEIAECTWTQALKSLDAEWVQSIIWPQYYHLDQGIVFSIASVERDTSTRNCWKKTTAAFRSNALIRIFSTKKQKVFRLQLEGADRLIEAIGDNTSEVCEKFVKQINKLKVNNNKCFVALKTCNDRRINADGVLISPLLSTDCTVITVTRKSDHEFCAVIAGVRVSIKNNQGRSREEIRDRLFEKIEIIETLQCQKIEDASIKVYLRGGPNRHRENCFRVAVLNQDDGIALTGSSRMTVTLGAPALSGGKDSADIVLDNALVMENENAYIINVPGQWRHRPGIDSTAETDQYGVCPGIEYASPHDSLFRRWMPAGTFMATYTRMTTMEAANESARHAVNAILRKIVKIDADQRPVVFNGQGRLIGDFCEIWDPEEHELADLEPLKKLDEALMRQGLPHVLDILRVSDTLEKLDSDISQIDALKEIVRVLGVGKKSPLSGADNIDDVLRFWQQAFSIHE